MHTDSCGGDAPPGRLFPPAILEALRCPVCGQALAQDPSRVFCHGGHSFDRARQGYVTVGVGRRAPKNADSAAMVAARELLLASGLYAPIRQAAAALIAEHLPAGVPPLMTDLAGGTGYYLAGILDRLPGWHGICIDLSTAALKRAARCHPRAAAIGADLLGPLPLAAGSVGVVTSFFGPRPIPEIARVMASEGVLVVVTPTVRHLSELVAALGMVTVDPHKEERLVTSLRSFTRIAHHDVEFEATVTRAQARALAVMGPSAHHVTPEHLDTRLAGLQPATRITVSVVIGIHARADGAAQGVGADGFEPPTARV